MACVPAPVLMEMSLALMEGARKYGRHNYRKSPVLASIYYDAAMRHIMAWWEGEEFAKDSGMHHLAHAMACLAIIRDTTLQGTFIDDRPPTSPDYWMTIMNEQVEDLLEKYPDCEPPVTNNNKDD